METIESINKLGSRNDKADILCSMLDEFGWDYDRNNNRIKIAFEPDNANITQNNIIIVVDVFDDKLAISATNKINALDKAEMIKLLNYINCEKIYFGRYVLTANGDVWYDFSIDIIYYEFDSEACYRVIYMMDKCINRFSNAIYSVSICDKTAENAIAEI